jgi:hypothetical protein
MKRDETKIAYCKKLYTDMDDPLRSIGAELSVAPGQTKRSSPIGASCNRPLLKELKSKLTERFYGQATPTELK